MAVLLHISLHKEETRLKKSNVLKKIAHALASHFDVLKGAIA